MKDILELPEKQLKKHIPDLAKIYKQEYGRNVCFTCPGDIQNMISTLKNHFNMTSFKLKKPQVIYKMKKGSATTISNPKMTDELAIEFLSIRPERIELFSEFPENWKDLIKGQAEPEASKEEPCDCDEEHEEPCEDCLREKLKGMKVNELSKAYPDIQYYGVEGMTKDKFIDLVIEAENKQ